MDIIRKFLKPFLLVGAVVLGVLLTGQSQLSHAATITVNTTDDELNSDGDCSLREAIQAANTNGAVDACTAGSGIDTVVVPAGTYILSIAGSSEEVNATGDLDITTSLTLNGNGASTTIIDGAGLDRVFDIHSGVTVNISGVTIRNGTETYLDVLSWRGGGIKNDGTLTVTNSTVSGNVATKGGGIFNDGTLTVTNSTISGNRGLLGGGISNWSSSTLTVTNSTISGNKAYNAGGGILNDYSSTVTVTSSTVSGNRADFGGDGIANSTGGTFTVKNTIIADNVCYNIISSGYNLIDNNSCVFTATGDLQNTDPLLGPLADNGGPTQTHALLSGSPAIDAGSPDCPPPATDQRGVTRPQGGGCDIGSYETETATDADGDGIQDQEDNCPADANTDQADTDNDGVGDVCDPCPNDPFNDADGDTICGDVDNCPTAANIDQTDTDSDGVGDVCNDGMDSDGDEWKNELDNCPTVPNADQADFDGDGYGDLCDVCPNDPGNDADGDGYCFLNDNCPLVTNSDQIDTDGDGEGDVCDADDDNDGALDGADNCPLTYNPDQADFDGDVQGDACDLDTDGDNVVDAQDQCLLTPPNSIVNDNGCSIEQLCPCDGAWKNHGAYVSCVAHKGEDFLSASLITAAEKDAIVSEAGQSNCGAKK